MEEKLARLEELRRESELGGGQARLDAQHARGKLSARARLEDEDRRRHRTPRVDAERTPLPAWRAALLRPDDPTLGESGRW